MDRGTCFFSVKAHNIQAAGAIGMVLANNVPDTSALGMTGDDDSITIPLVSVTQASGATLRANLAGGVAVRLRVDPNHLSGADSANRMLLFAPDPVQTGTSTSHWDSSAYPPPADAAEQLLGPAAHRGPDAAAAAGHRLGDRGGTGAAARLPTVLCTGSRASESTRDMEPAG